MGFDADLDGPFEASMGSNTNPSAGDPEQANFFETLESSASGLSVAPGRNWIDRCGPEARAFFDALVAASLESDQPNDLLDRCLQVQEHERLRIGQELHDSTGQLLVSLKLSVAYLRHLDEGQGHEAVFDEIGDTLRRIDHEIRTIAYMNYPAELDSDGLVGALRALARGFGARTGIRVRFTGICNHALDGGLGATALLRVAQEALVNVYRHARATSVSISLARRKDNLELKIEDDGRGISRDDNGDVFQGVGLHGMRHRIEGLGGRFSLPRLDQGTRICATVPLRHFGQPLAA
jgi:signal transduction histidine kinase